MIMRSIIAFLHKARFVISLYAPSRSRRTGFRNARVPADAASGILVHAGAVCSVTGIVKNMSAVELETNGEKMGTAVPCPLSPVFSLKPSLLDMGYVRGPDESSPTLRNLHTRKQEQTA